MASHSFLLKLNSRKHYFLDEPENPASMDWFTKIMFCLPCKPPHRTWILVSWGWWALFAHKSKRQCEARRLFTHARLAKHLNLTGCWRDSFASSSRVSDWKFYRQTWIASDDLRESMGVGKTPLLVPQEPPTTSPTIIAQPIIKKK